jgi:hypothetical protein
MHQVLKPLKQLFRNLYFLMFLNGFLLASLFYFKMEDSYENNLFSVIKSSIDNQITPKDTKDSIVIKAMNACYQLMKDRAPTFGHTTSFGLEADLVHPASVDLMTTRGACGSYSQVLARMIQDFHYPLRLPQMKANGVYAAHNLVEVNTGNDDNSWVVLDPTYNTYFVRPDGKLASFRDVQADWNYYQHQVPKNYDLSYHYEDVRYSNWTKIPVLLPGIKKLLDMTMGKEKADTFSMRMLFLHMYQLYLYITLLLYIPVLFFTLRIFVKTKVFPREDIPLTFGNFFKYLRPRPVMAAGQ